MTYDPAENSRKSYDVAIDVMREKLASFRCERIHDATLFLGDCREILPLLPKVDAVVTDPPYGIGEAAGKAKTRTSGLTSKIRNAQVYRRDYGDDNWDNEPISDDLIKLVLGGARWSVIFGGNYYTLPPAKCWLIWDKLNGETDFADCEMAWTNLPKAVRRIQYLWNGCMRANGEKRGDHPTQKPVGVMKWVLQQLPSDTRSVIDPMMGSGTTGVACVQMGLRFIGIEREPRYFEAAIRRIREAAAQPRLILEGPEQKPTQGGLL